MQLKTHDTRSAPAGARGKRGIHIYIRTCPHVRLKSIDNIHRLQNDVYISHISSDVCIASLQRTNFDREAYLIRCLI